MPAPKGNTNGKAAWFSGSSEEKANLTARVPLSLRDRVRAALVGGESVSEFLTRAIELLIKERSQPTK